MPPLNKLEDTVSSWPQISVHPHQFSAREFCFEKGEVGHVHDGGIVDIPFPRPIRGRAPLGRAR
jgi:Luciferase